MINVTLPDGSVRSFEESLSVGAIARSIAPSLGKAAVAGRLDGDLVDLSHVVSADAQLAIVTTTDAEGVDVIRHSTAHLLAHAVKELYPSAQVTIGPVIEDGFYYDFSFDRAFTPDDLLAIEKKMKQLSKKDMRIERSVRDRDEASNHFQSIGEAYKAEIIRDLPEGEEISLYTQGDFTDLCRGPHVPSTSKLKAFKLLKVAGAYWRGNSDNAMLQRIYGTAWGTQEDLDAHLFKLEEAEKRDHRKLGRQLDLFHSQEEAPGMVFWRPKGWRLWQQVEQYMRRVYEDNGYQEVKCPQILDVSLWKKSGHWDNFHDNMFFTASENREYAVKPMNCPGHVQIFNSSLHSYRDLPLRYGEFGGCHRNEPSGALHGLMRVRAFTQDDGHIFCTDQQIEKEVVDFHRLALNTYGDFEFKDVAIKLALRPEKRLGDDSVWDHAEAALRSALQTCGVSWEELPGEGAFYGPKIEYHLKDSIGRSWQCGTIQVDFMMPQRLGAEYVSEDNARKTPVMLHRAIVGSMERFIGILIEHHAGAMPLWLSPIQIVVMTVADRHSEYVQEVVKQLISSGFRVVSDLRNEKITYKIREHSLQKLPYQLIVGDKEVEASQVAVRCRGGEDLGAMPLETLYERLNSELSAKR
ncbi:MAG: threonine--tRNA ligase [Burkholderiales bacterium]|jgi:threonyl-tRNA synthetase|tara:strand:- start:70 stop:1977 length:1908 start_codon:yes stop_codon:yes gene_type:complete